TLDVAGETMAPGDILVVRQIAGQQAAEAAEGMTVVLDTHVTEALRLEGLAREIINRVQNLRKQRDLDVSQRIELVAQCDGDLQRALLDPELRAMIERETLAKIPPHDVEIGEALAALIEPARENVDGEPLLLSLRPL